MFSSTNLRQRRKRKMETKKPKNITVDLSKFQPNILERAVSLEIAKSFEPVINPNEPITIKMAVSNAFLSGIAFARRGMTDEEKEDLRKVLEESIKRIEENDKQDMQQYGA